MEILDLFLNNYKELVISWYQDLKKRYDVDVKNLKEEFQQHIEQQLILVGVMLIKILHII